MSSRQRNRLVGLGAVVTIATSLAWIVLIFSAIGLIAASRDAYGYRGAETATVTVSGDCVTTISRRGHGGTECPARWSVGGKQVSGTVTDHRGGELPAKKTFRAQVYGETARTGLDRGTSLWGLVSPWSLAVSLLVAILGTFAATRLGSSLEQTAMDVGDPARLGLYPSRKKAQQPAVDDDTVLDLAEGLGLGEVRYVQRMTVGLRGRAIGFALLIALALVFGNALRVILFVAAGLLLLVTVGQVYLARTDKRIWAIFEKGAVRRGQDGATFAVRYDQIDTLWVEQRQEADRRWRQYRARTTDGRDLVVDKDVVAHDLVGDRLLRHANAEHLPLARHRLALGQSVAFGALTATPAGLVSSGTTAVPWADYRDIAVEEDHVVLRSGEQVSRLPLAQVPWAPTLVQLADELRGSQG